MTTQRTNNQIANVLLGRINRCGEHTSLKIDAIVEALDDKDAKIAELEFDLLNLRSSIKFSDKFKSEDISDKLQATVWASGVLCKLDEINSKYNKLESLLSELVTSLEAIRDKQPGFGGMPAVWCKKVAEQALSKLREYREKK